MSKTYTKKQITEAIAYWKKQLDMMNETATQGDNAYLYVTQNNPSFNEPVRKIGASGFKKKEDPYAAETLNSKLMRYSTCVPVPYEKAYQIYIPYDADVRALEKDLFALTVEMGGHRFNENGKGAQELFSVDDALMEKIIQKFLNDHPGTQLN